MASLHHILVATVLFATVALGQNYSNLKVTNGTQEYFRIAQAELLYKVKLSELENDALEARFIDRLGVIEQHQFQILNATQQVNQTLIPMQALSIPRKYCIQTYDSQFITYESAKEQLKMCITKASNLGYNLASPAKSVTRSARFVTLNTLPYNLNQYCKPASYNYNQTRIEQCYINYVNQATELVQNNLLKAQTYREQAQFDMNTITLTAIQCSFDIERVVIVTMANTSKKIENCIDQLQRSSSMVEVPNKKALN